MRLNGIEIEDTFAEAFAMQGARITVTAVNEKWAEEAARAATGFAISVIGCGVEAGVEGKAAETPDGRPGFDCLFFASSKENLEKQLINRIGQAVMTAPTSACFNGALPEIPPDNGDAVAFNVGGKLRFFGDGYQASKVVGGKRYWRVPVMEGEFLVQEKFTMVKSVGGGNFLILAESVEAGLAAAEAAARAIKALRGVILPFPGGIVRSGSKVGSTYKFLFASTNTAYCPTIRRRVKDSALGDGVNSVMEIVIDGLTAELVGEAMRTGILAACQAPGVRKITAGNYGGKLGKFHFHLQELLATYVESEGGAAR